MLKSNIPYAFFLSVLKQTKKFVTSIKTKYFKKFAKILINKKLRNFRMVKEVAAITGGTSGLGKACVERFVKDGYEVSSTDT